jgi:uncharacterized membrane protein YkvI
VKKMIDFFVDFGMFSLIIVGIMAFMGVVSTKLAESFGGKKHKEAFEHNSSTQQGWKGVGGKEKKK